MEPRSKSGNIEETILKPGTTEDPRFKLRRSQNPNFRARRPDPNLGVWSQTRGPGGALIPESGETDRQTDRTLTQD